MPTRCLCDSDASPTRRLRDAYVIPMGFLGDAHGILIKWASYEASERIPTRIPKEFGSEAYNMGCLRDSYNAGFLYDYFLVFSNMGFLWASF